MIIACVTTLVDSLTDIMVLHYWISKPDPDYWWFGIGLSFIVISDIASFFFSLVAEFDVNRESHMSGRFFMHIIGLGVLHDCILNWNDLDEDNIISWELDESSFFNSRLAESCLEALPFTVLQMYVMLREGDYNILLILSIVCSLGAAALPIADAINVKFRISFQTHISHIVLWMADSFVRCVPVVVFIVEFSNYTQRIFFVGGITLLNFFYSLLFVREWLENYDPPCVACLFLTTLVISMIMASSVKILAILDGGSWFENNGDVLSISYLTWSWVEVLLRFALSAAVAVLLYVRETFNNWQFLVFIILIFVSGFGQIYWYKQLDKLPKLPKRPQLDKLPKLPKRPPVLPKVVFVSELEEAVKVEME